MDSDSSESEWDGERYNSRGHEPLTYYKLNHSEKIFLHWNMISPEVKYEATHRMKMRDFWLPILLQRDEGSRIGMWALKVGVIGKKQDLTIQNIQKIETLEAIFRAIERGLRDNDKAKAVVWLSDMFSLRLPTIYENAVQWLEETGDPGIADLMYIFGSKIIGIMVLEAVFSQYACYILSMGADLQLTYQDLISVNYSCDKNLSDDMKMKGNEYFEKGHYEEAVKFYTQAIKNDPENHLLYGNRALCYIKSEKYLKAAADGKRAILIEPLWTKGHYRYCEALMFLGEFHMAIYANTIARDMCQGVRNGIKDLDQQNLKIHSLAESYNVELPVKTQKQREHAAKSGSAYGIALNKGATATNKDVPATNKGAPATNKGAPATNKGAPATNKGAPATNKGAPATNKGAPATNKGATATNKGATATNKGAPATNKGATAVSKDAPSTNHDTPAANKGATAANKGATAANKGAPAANKGATAANKGAPAANKDNPATKDKAPNKIAPAVSAPGQNKVSQKMGKKTRKNEKTADEESSSKAPEPAVSGVSTKTQEMKPEHPAASSNTTVKPESKNSDAEQAKADNAALCQELSRLMQDAHAALNNSCSRNTEQAFRHALALLENTTPKDLGLSTQDVLLLLYGRASALTEIGQPEELQEAQRVLKKIESFEERMFQCLVFYGFGRVFVRENRFAAALEPLLDSLQMVHNHIMPGKLTWPFTKDVVQETEPGYLKGVLEEAIDLCKFPPPPDAICRFEKCGKAEIYLTDPDFKGFIRICCCQSCVVEYHASCWKAFKASSFCDKNEKDFLQGPCLTPDCVGKICSIKIFDATGLPKKCKLEETIPKAEGRQKKPKVNQKCTSLKKLKSKEERRLRREQHRQARREMQTSSSEALQQGEASACQAPEKAWHLYRDRVLLQISQKMELLREEKSLQVATFASALRPWLQLDSIKKNQLALKLLCWEDERLETVGQFVEVLLERKNRVWARVFIQVLSNCEAINPKLSDWACYLNSTGLSAARDFLERYSGELEQLDLTILLEFEPIQEMVIEKLGTKPELLSSIGLSVTEYLKQAPAQDTRLFIWALEEHRDNYVPFHSILDGYFDIMGGHCSIVQKSSENKNNSPLKNRVRKKKQKEAKVVFPVQGAMACGRGGVASQEELDTDFIEDNSLLFHHHGDPFRVPSHIQEQVADFERQYNSSRNGGQHNFFDINPDPTVENLYDYFVMILEEHGPLAPDEPLLMGQLDNFPPEAQTCIRESGGLQAFLLQSPSFMWMEGCIFLAQQQPEEEAGLDQLDDFEYSGINATDAYLQAPAFTNGFYDYNWATTEVYPIIPNPQYYPCPPAPVSNMACTFTGTARESGNTDAQQEAFYVLSNPEKEVDLYSAEAGGGSVEEDPSSSSVAAEENLLWRDAAVQTGLEMSSVAVNTEPDGRWEKQPGDINKMQKSINSMEEKIEMMSGACEDVPKEEEEDLTDLKDEIQKITANIQVTNTELLLFQQKLEEEVKNDQKEKKANQEVLRSLKVERDQLMEEQKSLSQKLQETTANHDTVLTDFIQSCNQLAAEKRTLEDEIQSCTALLESTTRRAHKAQTLTQELFDQMKGSRRTTELPLFGATNLPEAPPRGRPQASSSLDVQASAAEAAPALVQLRTPDRSLERPSNTVFDKAMEQLAAMFPHCSRSYLRERIQKFRSSSGGTLSSMQMQDMVGGVAQLILDDQEKQKSAAVNGSAGRVPPPPVWQKPEPQRNVAKQGLNVEDPCIICHEDMDPRDMCVLQCRHIFHDQCIRPWLKDHNTCPICRVHTLLPDDFPALSARRRQAP